MKRILMLLGAVLALALAVVGLMVYTGTWQLNHPTQPVHGVDVSHYQGDIDWPKLAAQDLDFAFVKATEGSTHLDETFAANWAGARAAGLRVGAYHFFSYDSDGADQARHFIGTVPVEADALPPVIDVEFYGDYFQEPKAAEDVVPQLSAMVEALRAHYGVSPVLYVTGESYELYVEGRFEDCDLWIRSVFSAPKLPDGRDWTFWQYSDRQKLEGYTGAESFIDMDVYRGTESEFAAYPEH